MNSADLRVTEVDGEIANDSTVAHREIADDFTMASPALAGKSCTAVILAVVQAVCAFSIMTAKAALLTSSIAAFTTVWARYLHRDLFRIPMLALAILLSVVNLYLLWRFYSLRSRGVAAWRKKALKTGDKLKSAFILFLSLLSLLISAAEI